MIWFIDFFSTLNTLFGGHETRLTKCDIRNKFEYIEWLGWREFIWWWIFFSYFASICTVYLLWIHRTCYRYFFSFYRSSVTKLTCKVEKKRNNIRFFCFVQEILSSLMTFLLRLLCKQRIIAIKDWLLSTIELFFFLFSSSIVSVPELNRTNMEKKKMNKIVEHNSRYSSLKTITTRKLVEMYWTKYAHCAK